MQEDVSTFSKSIEPFAATNAKYHSKRDAPHAARPFFHSSPLILVVRLPPVPRHRVQIAPCETVALRLLPCAVPEPICNSQLARQNVLDDDLHLRKSIRNAHHTREPNLHMVDLSDFLHAARNAARAQTPVERRKRKAVAADPEKARNGRASGLNRLAGRPTSEQRFPLGEPLVPRRQNDRFFLTSEKVVSASSKAAARACNSASRKASLPKAVNAKRPQYRYKIIPVAHASASVIVTSPSRQSVRSVPGISAAGCKSFTF